VRSDRERLLDILDAIAHVEKHVSGGRPAFDASEPIQSLVLRGLQIIGEAARAISADLKDRHPQVPWPEIVRMRHFLVHRYFDIDREIVWAVVSQDLPALKQKVQAILGRLDRDTAET
jgi:uncharacterized protein with HEPN domain